MIEYVRCRNVVRLILVLPLQQPFEVLHLVALQILRAPVVGHARFLGFERARLIGEGDALAEADLLEALLAFHVLRHREVVSILSHLLLQLLLFVLLVFEVLVRLIAVQDTLEMLDLGHVALLPLSRFLALKRTSALI